MPQLTPFVLKERYFVHVAAEVQRLLNNLIYRPLMDLLEQPFHELENRTSDALLDAIRDGSIWYDSGEFHGTFSAATSKALRGIGASYNAAARTWSLGLGFLPDDVRFAQARADAFFDSLRKEFIHTLDDMKIESIDRHSRTPEKYGQAIDWMEGDFQKAVKGITIAPKLTDDQRHIIAREWGENLNLYIKDWAAENILKLRTEVQEHALQGGRAENMVKMLQANYGVSQRKAHFLARQETSLLMSKFRETRYKDIGIEQYRWSGVDDGRERPDHVALNNKIFSWDSPPITNRETGARNHPGEDFGCRCVAVGWFE